MADEIVAKVQTEDVSQVGGNVLGMVAGDNAVKTYLLWTATDGAVTAHMSLDSVGADFIETADDKSYAITGTVVARDVATGDTAYLQVMAVVNRGAGVATTVLLQQNTADFFSGAVLVNFPTHVTFAVDVVTGFIHLDVTGYAATVVKFTASLQVTETGNAV